MSEFTIRLPDHVMEQANAAAAEDNLSIDEMFVSFIVEGAGHRRGLQMLGAQAARANVGAALAILDKVPSVPPEPGDEIPETQDHGPGLGRG